MSPFLRLLACTALLFALSAGPASAKSRAAQAQATTPQALAVSVAKKYWGATPCDGAIKVLTRQRAVAGLDEGADAWVTFGTPIGDNNLLADAATYTDCTIALSRSRWPTRGAMIADWDMLCMTVTHEVGHLLGNEHEPLSGSIMVPVFSDYSAEPQTCRSSRPRARR